MSIRWKKTILLFILFFLFIGFGCSQIPKVKLAKRVPLNSENNPTEFCIQSLLEDNAGRLWMKTCGVAEQLYALQVFQFDGYNRWPVTLSRGIWEDYKTGYIKGISQRGALYGNLNGPDNKSILFSYDVDVDSVYYTSINGELVAGIVENKPDKYWVVTKKKDDYLIYQWDGISINHFYTIPNSELFNEEENIFRTTGDSHVTIEDNTLWLFDKNLPIIAFDLLAKTYTNYGKKYLPIESEKTIFTNEIARGANTSVVIRDSILYFCHSHLGNSFFYLNFKHKEKQFQPLSILPEGAQARSVWEDEQGNLLFVFDFPNSNSHEMSAYLLDTNNKLFNYSAMFEDLPFLKFVSSKNFKKEAFISASVGAYYVEILPEKSLPITLTFNAIRHIRQNQKGEILMRVNGGIHLLENKNSSIAINESCIGIANKLSGRKELISDPKGYVWGKFGHHLSRHTPDKNGNCVNHTLDFNGSHSIFVTDEIIAFLEEQTRELILYNVKTRKRISNTYPPIKLTGGIHQMWSSKDHILWVASNSGLYKINWKTGELKKYGDSKDFEDHRILVIHEDQNGLLWLGTASRGIHVFDPKEEKISFILNESEGLSNNLVVGILEDDEGDIWAATYNGLNIIKPNGTVIDILDEDDGLTHFEFNRYAHFKSTDGRLFFGALKGLNIIDPKKTKQSLGTSKSLKIFISNLTFFDQELGKTVSIRNYNPNNTLVLPADSRFLSINVGMSNYGFTSQNRYTYKLEGIDKDWTYLGSEHLIRLPNLPAGKYDLIISGIDQNGNWSSNTIRIPIYAKEFFYKQTWFYILCALPFLLFAIIWIRRLRKEKGILEKEVKKRTIEIRKDKELIEQQAHELQQLDQMKSRFFANISHDLRTPITLISGPAELLAEEEYIKKKKSFHQAIVTISQNSKRLLRLIDEVFDLARLDSKKVKLHEESIPIVEFTKAIFNSYSLEAKRKKIHYQFKAEILKDFELLVDPNRLEKILNNLLSNALKFTTFGDTVMLSLTRDQNYISIAVADTGRGIPEEDLPHVFERYFQSKNEKLIQTSGSGIGLSLCQEFAQLMKGKLTVESSFGRGATFKLSFPAKQSTPKSTWQKEDTFITIEEAPITTTATHPPNAEQATLMIVEDNPEVQSFVKLLLENEYKVLCFDDGQAALDFLEQQSAKNLPIDLILSDINMPRLDGYGLIEAIKKNEKWHHLPMIMLTARQQERSKLKALRMGVDDYLTKPFSPIELKVRIQNILENYQNRVATKKEFIAVNLEFEDTISADQVWLKELEEHSLVALDQKIELTINYLADKMALGPRQTARKVKLLTGLTIGKYIHEIKLQKARHLLEQKTYPTVAEVGYACGFNSPSYFTKIFNRHFGKTPTSYY